MSRKIGGMGSVGWVLAAALVVAGGVGTGWAQASAVKNAPFNKATVPGTITQNMALKYEVVAKPVSIDFTGLTGTTDAALLAYDGTSGNSSPSQTGNVGTITVTSEHENWDIEFATANLGRLRLGGATGGKPLLMSKTATTNDTARLGIQIGVQQTTINPSNASLISAVPQNWLNSSKATPVGFSKVISAASSASSDTTGVSTELGDRAASSTWSGGAPALDTDGFGPSAATGNKITFIINAGLNVNGTTVKLRGNAPGTYTDTLKFTLIAGE